MLKYFEIQTLYTPHDIFGPICPIFHDNSSVNPWEELIHFVGVKEVVYVK